MLKIDTMKAEKLFERGNYLAPECNVVFTNLATVLCLSGGGSGSDFGDGGSDIIEIIDDPEIDIIDLL